MSDAFKKLSDNEILVIKRDSEQYPFEYTLSGGFGGFINVNEIDSFSQKIGENISKAMKSMMKKDCNFLCIRLTAI